MRAFALVVWLLVPVGAIAWHYGPGQDYLQMDDANRALRLADHFVAEKQWGDAVDAYDDALKSIPADRTGDILRVRIEKAKAEMLAGQLPEAHQELIALVDELKDSTDDKLIADARSALANAQYYSTWLMRLEGRTPAVWEPEIEASRQTYKLLAEQADKSGDHLAAKSHREDLESAIRLARMDLGELQSLPLPSQCNCSGCCNGRGQCNGKGRGKGRGPAPTQAKDSRGAGGEMAPDTRGH